MTRPTINKLRDDNEGKLPAYAWPGGYQMIYIDENNDILCPDCANKPEDEYTVKIVQWDIFYEGAPEECADCGKMIESAYGDPDEPGSEGDW